MTNITVISIIAVNPASKILRCAPNSVLGLLQRHGILPVSKFKYGRGYSYHWDRDAVVALAAKLDAERAAAKVTKQVAENAPAAQPEVPQQQKASQIIIDRLDDLQRTVLKLQHEQAAMSKVIAQQSSALNLLLKEWVGPQKAQALLGFPVPQ